MSVTRIIDGLEQMTLATGPEADAAARLGFLEWAFCQPGEASARAARHALATAAAQDPNSAAARAFVGYLRQALLTPCQPVRRGGRMRRLH